MTGVAISNFQGVDRLLETPDMAASQHIKVLGTDSARTLLRHQVSELNRYLFESWEMTQLCVGVVLIITLLFATNGEKLYMGLTGLLLLFVIVEYFLVTPQVASLGRAIDFIPDEAPSVERIKYWRFQNAYWVLEVLKMITLVGVSLRLLTVRHRNRSPATGRSHRRYR